jgi:HEAT repeats
MQEDAGVKTLCEALLKDSDSQVRSKAAEVLGKIGNKKAVLSLCTSIETDNDANVRICAILALGRIYKPRLNKFVDLLRRTFPMSEPPKISVSGGNLNYTAINTGSQVVTQNNSTSPQNLAKAVAEIQQILKQQLVQADVAIVSEQDQALAVDILHQAINRNPTLKSRLRSAITAGGTEAIKIALENFFKSPLIAISVETIKGWIEAD